MGFLSCFYRNSHRYHVWTPSTRLPNVSLFSLLAQFGNFCKLDNRYFIKSHSFLRGYIGPGGIDLLYSEGESKPDCIGGATGYIDRWLVGVDHLYQNPTAKHVYKSGAFDPEGVLGEKLGTKQSISNLICLMSISGMFFYVLQHWLMLCPFG